MRHAPAGKRERYVSQPQGACGKGRVIQYPYHAHTAWATNQSSPLASLNDSKELASIRGNDSALGSSVKFYPVKRNPARDSAHAKSEQQKEWHHIRRQSMWYLGLGLTDQNQKMTVAAMRMADMKVCAQRS